MASGRLRRQPLTVREIVTMALLAATLFGIQVTMSFLPNIELVSLLIVLYTRRFRVKTLFIIYAFALFEGAFYGFGLWFINYLYVWTVLWLASMALIRQKDAFVHIILMAAFGFLFGTLCSIPYLFIGGFEMALAYIISGIPFDLIHGFSNAILAIILYKPLDRLLERLFRGADDKALQGETDADANH